MRGPPTALAAGGSSELLADVDRNRRRGRVVRGCECRGDLDVGAFIGIAEAPFASGEYGYIRVKGPASVVVESGAVAGDSLQLSGTVGKLKKTTTSGDQVATALAASDNASTAAIAVYVGK